MKRQSMTTIPLSLSTLIIMAIMIKRKEVFIISGDAANSGSKDITMLLVILIQHYSTITASQAMFIGTGVLVTTVWENTRPPKMIMLWLLIEFLKMKIYAPYGKTGETVRQNLVIMRPPILIMQQP